MKLTNLISRPGFVPDVAAGGRVAAHAHQHQVRRPALAAHQALHLRRQLAVDLRRHFLAVDELRLESEEEHPRQQSCGGPRHLCGPPAGRLTCCG